MKIREKFIKLQNLTVRLDIQMSHGDEAPPRNETLLQGFEWFSDQGHWRRLEEQLPYLKSVGISSIWLPPGCKAGHEHSNGYDTYDLYDLGEFDQKGSRHTKWGTKEELLGLVHAAQVLGIGLYWDAVLGHKAAADGTEDVEAVEVDPKDRTIEIGEPRQIQAWLQFSYPGRCNQYSVMKYNAFHFNGTDYDQRTGHHAIYKLRDWAKDVDKENGNFDYLLLSNVDLSNLEVREDLFRWADWIIQELSLRGFRFDAAKHISQSFMDHFISRLDPNIFLVGEYASADAKVLEAYVKRMRYRLQLFDFPLHSKFVRLSRSQQPDLPTILSGTLAQMAPRNAVTFVTNHDTQERGQDSDQTVAPWFIPLAYALILLTSVGQPCVFYGDLFGVNGPEASKPGCDKLARLILARRLYAYGEQSDYTESPLSLGFTRHGHPAHSANAGLAVLMTASYQTTSERMYVGRHHAYEWWHDSLAEVQSQVVIDTDGFGFFHVSPRSVAMWIGVNAEGGDSIVKAQGGRHTDSVMTG